MKHISFESSQWDESNGINFIKFWSLNTEIVQHSVKSSMWDNSVNIDATDMKYIPFESSQWDDSNGIKNIEIQSLDAEIIAKTNSHLYITRKARELARAFKPNQWCGSAWCKPARQAASQFIDGLAWLGLCGALILKYL